ncbi:MAG: hypothetical protein Q7T56_18460 [Nocardioidaceae bacterium]|nr:hypothetical protein [Nocardioidaceae bacterium]
MALGPGPDPLERATDALRADTPDWPPVQAAIKGHVRTLVRPSPTLLAVSDAGLEAQDATGSRTWVSGRVLTVLVRDRVRALGVDPRDVDLDLDGDHCRGVTVSVVGAYDTDLLEQGERVRAAVAEVLLDLLGPDPARDPAGEVRVHVVDVVVGDPRTT